MFRKSVENEKKGQKYNKEGPARYQRSYLHKST